MHHLRGFPCPELIPDHREKENRLIHHDLPQKNVAFARSRMASAGQQLGLQHLMLPFRHN